MNLHGNVPKHSSKYTMVYLHAIASWAGYLVGFDHSVLAKLVAYCNVIVANWLEIDRWFTAILHFGFRQKQVLVAVLLSCNSNIKIKYTVTEMYRHTETVSGTFKIMM